MRWPWLTPAERRILRNLFHDPRLRTTRQLRCEVGIMTPARFYPALSSLERRGLITPAAQPRTYVLTSAGICTAGRRWGPAMSPHG